MILKQNLVCAFNCATSYYVSEVHQGHPDMITDNKPGKILSGLPIKVEGYPKISLVQSIMAFVRSFSLTKILSTAAQTSGPTIPYLVSTSQKFGALLWFRKKSEGIQNKNIKKSVPSSCFALLLALFLYIK